VTVGFFAPPSTTAARAPTVRMATFSVSLVERGSKVGSFTCRLRATQYRSGFRIEAWPLRGWLELPRGKWGLTFAIRDRRLPPTGSFGSGQHADFDHVGKIAVTSNTSGSYSVDSGTIGPKIACGVLAYRRGVAYRTYRRLFATVAWPSFKLVGANVVVDPTQPGGGIG
jgi:hypothetical protein